MVIEPEKYIIEGTGEIFSTMLMMEVAPENTSSARPVEISSNITSMIGLGGALRGMLAVHCPADTAKNITASFLGVEVEEIDDDVKDAIGEIANMVAGNLKVFFAEAGVDTELAIPTTTIGDSVRVRGVASAQRYVVGFSCDAGRFWIELLYVSS